MGRKVKKVCRSPCQILLNFPAIGQNSYGGNSAGVEASLECKIFRRKLSLVPTVNIGGLGRHGRQKRAILLAVQSYCLPLPSGFLAHCSRV